MLQIKSELLFEIKTFHHGVDASEVGIPAGTEMPERIEVLGLHGVPLQILERVWTDENGAAYYKQQFGMQSVMIFND